jgi:hypothetical protein
MFSIALPESGKALLHIGSKACSQFLLGEGTTRTLYCSLDYMYNAIDQTHKMTMGMGCYNDVPEILVGCIMYYLRS